MDLDHVKLLGKCEIGKKKRIIEGYFRKSILHVILPDNGSL